MSHSRGKLQQGIKFQLDAMHSFTIIKKYLTLTCTSMVASKKKRERCGPTCLPAIITGMLTKHHSMCRRSNKRERERCTLLLQKWQENVPARLVRAGRWSGTAWPPLMCSGQEPKGPATIALIICAMREREQSEAYPSVQRSTDKSFDKIGRLTDMCRATRLDFAPTLSLYHKRF